MTVVITATEPHDLGELLLSGHPAVKGVLVLPGNEVLSASPSVRLERILNFREVDRVLNARTLEGSVDAEGAFVIRGAAAGRYRLVASDGIWKKTLGPVNMESDDVDLGKVLLEALRHPRARGEDRWEERLVLADHPGHSRPSTLTHPRPFPRRTAPSPSRIWPPASTAFKPIRRLNSCPRPISAWT